MMVDASGAVAAVNDSSGIATATAIETPSQAAAPRDGNDDIPPLLLPLLPPVEPLLAHAPPCILHARDCRVQRVKGDGSCAYRAVVCAAAARAGVVLTEDEERDEAQRLRLKVAECLRQHAHEMSAFVGDVDAYARAAAAPTAWADEPELLACSAVMAAPLALYVDAPDGFRLLRTLTASGCVTEVEPLRLLRSPQHYDALLNALAAPDVPDNVAPIRAAAASTTAIHSPPPFCPSSVPPCADAFVGARVAVAYDVRDENGAWLSRWFAGTVTEKTRRGWHVRFDDGDEKTLVKAYNVRVAVASYTRYFGRAPPDVQAAAAPRRKRKRSCSERTARALAQRGAAPAATDGDVASAVASRQAASPPPPALFSPAREALPCSATRSRATTCRPRTGKRWR
jgi:hypothetical protein